MAELLAVGTWCPWLFLLRASALPESGLSSVVTLSWRDLPWVTWSWLLDL